MSSDTFRIQILSVDAVSVELRATTGTASGLSNLATTRSFALMAIEDGMAWDKSTPLQQAMATTVTDGGNPPVWEQDWHRQHVSKFVASTELLERSDIITDEPAWWVEYEAETAPRHSFVLRVRMTDPRYTEGVTVGNSYGTTAFDAWGPDSASPGEAQIAAVTGKASRWPR